MTLSEKWEFPFGFSQSTVKAITSNVNSGCDRVGHSIRCRKKILLLAMQTNPMIVINVSNVNSLILFKPNDVDNLTSFPRAPKQADERTNGRANEHLRERGQME